MTTKTITPADTPMMRQYLAIKKAYPKEIVFFRLGDFYEMFLEDAVTAANVLGLTLTGRGKDENRVPMCGVPYHAADSYLHKLVQAGFRVALCEQVEDPSQATGITKREVVKVVTPGTLMGQGALDEKDQSLLVSVSESGKKGDYALAYTDLSTGEFWVATAETYTALETEIRRLEPKELILPERLLERGLEDSFASFSPVTFTPIHAKDAEKKLCQFFSVQSLVSFGIGQEQEISVAAWGLIEYLKLTQKTALSQIVKMKHVPPSNQLLIDAVTKQNLELTSTIQGTRTGSLLSVLDRCKTAMGSRRLKQLISAPYIDTRMIERRLDALQCLLEDVLSREELREMLSPVYDLERLLSRIVMNHNNPKDLLALGDSLTAIQQLQVVVAQLDAPLLVESAEKIFAAFTPEGPLSRLVQTITSAIQASAPAVIRDGGVIREGYHQGLDELRSTFQSVKAWIGALEESERQRTGIKSIKVRFNKVFGYYIEVPNSQRDHIPEDYIRKQTLANAERYITPQLKEKETVLLSGEEKEKQMEMEIYAELVQDLREFVPDVQAMAELIADVDVLQSLAAVSHQRAYTRPRLRQEPVLSLKGSRHPVLETQSEQFISNDIHLGDQAPLFMLVTGPNMAGKSTLMRQVALSVVMAQMGCFVPADSAEIGITDKLFTRIGASDNLARGHSTFMVEMVETAAILNQATEHSLVLLDEIGRGTSTYDGISIAAAVTEHMHNVIRSRTLFATHYHELTVLEEKLERLSNYSMKIVEVEGKLVFTYTLQKGPADKSYGIHVAEMAGLPSTLLQRAQSLLRQFESQSIEGNTNQELVVDQLRLF